MRHGALIAVLAALLLPSVAADAHEFPVERSLLAQVSLDRVEMMLVYTEPAGPRTDLLIAKFDLDNDGEIAGPELKLAEGELTKRAFRGLELEFLGERAGMHPPEMKVKRTREGGLAAAFYLHYRLDEKVAERTFVVRLEGSAERIIPLVLVVEAGEGLKLKSSSSPIDGIATRSTELKASSEHRTALVVPSTEDQAK